jgi:hypothetical protein
MRTFRNALLAGVAAVTLGVAGTAFAQSDNVHVMMVRLPDGGLAQIRYSGNVAPQVTLDEASTPGAVFAAMPSLFGPESPFAAMERVSAEMDREAAAMFHQADAMAAEANSGQLTAAALRNLPPGSLSYTVVSTASGNGVCSQSLEIAATGNGPPRVVRHSSGNCGPTGEATNSASLPAATPQLSRPGLVGSSTPARTLPAGRPDVIWTGARGSKPYAGLVHEIPPATR